MQQDIEFPGGEEQLIHGSVQRTTFPSLGAPAPNNGSIVSQNIDQRFE